jgi:hypothetical protein
MSLIQSHPPGGEKAADEIAGVNQALSRHICEVPDLLFVWCTHGLLCNDLCSFSYFDPRVVSLSSFCAVQCVYVYFFKVNKFIQWSLIWMRSRVFL